LAIEIGEAREEGVVGVRDESGFGVEQRIGTAAAACVRD
jgi:hypothetical protein